MRKHTVCQIRGLRPFVDVFFGGPSRDVRRRQIALVESANLVRPESSDHGVKDAAVMEEDEIPLFPVVGVDQLTVYYVSVYGQPE